jgi:DNA-binding response OmpR family regulator
VTGRILLVEEDVVLGDVLAEVLRHSGYDVIVVNTLLMGGIDHFHSISTVILDIDTTSVEQELAWLKAIQPYDESLPIVLMGLQVPQQLREPVRVQLSRQQSNPLLLVQKPFRNEELLAAIRQAQERSVPRQVEKI